MSPPSTSGEPRPLRDLTLTDDDPDTVLGVMRAEWGDLSEPARELRRQCVQWMRAEQEHAVDGPAPLEQLLRRRWLYTVPSTWTTYALGRNGELLRTVSADGATRRRFVVTRKVPEPSELPATTRGGRYLAIYHGDPEILAHPGVIHRVRTLRRSVRLADVVVWHPADEGHALYSLRAGVGSRDGAPVPLPDGAAQGWEQTEEAR